MMPVETVLGVETSCDETAVAVVRRGTILASIVSSQAKLHARFGGVVPEVASRAHLDLMVPAVKAALEDAGIPESEIEAVAATVGPGLAGALLVGAAAAKGLAMAWGVPFIGVNHHEAHLFAAWLDEQGPPALPAVVLLVAGGHTMLILMRKPGSYVLIGQTVDDAAGEAFDKVARFLGLGYPGGPAIESAAKDGDPQAVKFPRPLLKEGYDFSFSGLKTAVVRTCEKDPSLKTEDVAASFQQAVIDVLVEKAMRAAREFGAKSVVLAGGVAANSLLRQRIAQECEKLEIEARIPEKKACTDNAAMVAACGMWHLNFGTVPDISVGIDPGLEMRFEAA